MRPARPSSATCLTLLIACLPITALAQFSNASLNGRHASRYEVAEVGIGQARFLPQAVEVLVYDGAGGVTGTRTFAVWDMGANGTFLSPRIVRQELVGSYSIDAEGLGSLTLSATPVLEFKTQGGSTVPLGTACWMSPDETRQLVVQHGGDGVSFNGMAVLRIPSYPAVPWGSLTWSADSLSQDSPCATPRLSAGLPFIPRMQH